MEGFLRRDNIFDLSKPTDYIAVKILMANKDKICPSMDEWAARPKETYEFVLNCNAGTKVGRSTFCCRGIYSRQVAHIAPPCVSSILV